MTSKHFHQPTQVVCRKNIIRHARKYKPATWLVAALISLPFWAAAQTLTITNGIQAYDALTNTTITMTGNCELHLTSTNNPLPGCVINLNSTNAWVLLPNIHPSVVSENYLSQFRVNGANAVLNGNVRLSECAMGTMVIPHSAAITPLQIFNGPNFLGASTQLGLYTYYTNTLLGAFNRNIGSFRLKRGYMATLAQNPDGTGASQVFIAQDADLDVGMLAANLSQPISFVRVFPWRWTAKKGWGGSSLITNTAPLWWYDWGNSQVSTLDMEYPPMKWSSGSGTSSIRNKQNSTHMLSYNEPDSTAQANMTVSAAITDWPSLMQWGMRVGAPAVSDSGVTGQGLDWLYSFMDQADNLGYRVDFIPIHYYKCGWSTAQFSNYLAQISATTGKPLWITEWNNGANWCSSGLPGSPAAQATAISNDIVMLENAPFVERYAIYQWFDPSTYLNLVSTNTPATLTPAGVAYLNMPSKIAYTQTLPSGGNRGIAQFHFDNDALDSSGYANNGFVVGDPNYVTGQVGQAIALDGTNSFIQLPPTMAHGSNFTFAAWVYWNSGANSQAVFDFGNDTTHYLYLTPSSSSGTLRFAICNGGSEQIVETPGLPIGQWQHIVVTLNGNSANLYTNGVLAAANGITITPANFNPGKNYLGKSQFPENPLFNGNLDEVQIADYVFTPAQIASLLTNSPPQFVTNLINGSSATQSIAYNGSIADTATDPDSGDTLSYSKASGPAWLNVAANGTLSGTPSSSDGGTNIFTVRVTDSAGVSAFAGLAINTIVIKANGIWNVDADGLWSNTNNWSNYVVANGAGYGADFSTVSLTTNHTVTLDFARSIGSLKFGNPSGNESWLLVASNNSALTLDAGNGGSPSITVNQNIATISASLNGTAGFTKSGAGTLMLSGINTYSDSTTINTGLLVIGGSGQLDGGVYSGNIIDNGIFSYNSSTAQTLSGNISGTGALTQNSGALTLSHNNTYTGGTTVNGGTLTLTAGGGNGAIINNLTINSGGVVNLTAGDALGYNAGACVTNVNLVGGTLANSSGGNEGYNTGFNLTGGTISSSGGAYNLNGAGSAVNSLATNIVSTISAPITLRAAGLIITTAQGTVPGGIDLNLSGAVGEQYGSFGFAKSGASTLLLSGANTYSGATAINAGTLLVNGSINSTAPVMASSSATLGGKGIINGPITIKAGGTLSPGINSTSLDILTVNNFVTLQTGSVTQMRVNKTSVTNDVIRLTGSITYGGTLAVTNLAGTLTVGDSFKLFSASSYGGAFSNVNPATPGAELLWNTNNLTVNGTLSIVLGSVALQFNSVSLLGGNLVVSGTGGAAGASFSVLAATNLALPVATWDVTETGSFDKNGNYSFTNNLSPDAPQQFFRIKIP